MNANLAFLDDLNKKMKPTLGLTPMPGASAQVAAPVAATPEPLPVAKPVNPDDWSNDDTMESILAAAIPTILGGLVGGVGGAAAGAQGGAAGVKVLTDQKALDRKDKKELAQKKAEADAKFAETQRSQANEDRNYQLNKEKVEIDRKKAGKEAANGKMLPPDKVLLVNEGNSIPEMLTAIGTTIESNKGNFGPIKGRFDSANPYAEKAQTIDAQVRAASQAFGRYMEGGVLRKEDEDKYRKMFPNLTDEPALAANKLAIVNKLLIDKQNSNISALRGAGYDVSSLDKGLKAVDLPGILGSGKPDPKIEEYAKQNGLTYGSASSILKGRGYGG